MLKLGDVLYRPCLSYAGYKNFINTSVVRSIINREDGDYILSYDAFRQSWTDSIHKSICTDAPIVYDARGIATLR